jgi:hypothetical protein
MFWPCVRARSMHAAVFLDSLTQKMGAARLHPLTNAASLIFLAKLMIYRDNPAKNRRDLMENPHCCRSVKRVLRAEYLNPGRALQQASALLSPLCCTLSELCCTLRATLHHIYAKLHHSELSYTLLIYLAPFWATLHPTELRCTLNELRCTIKKNVHLPTHRSFAVPSGSILTAFWPFSIFSIYTKRIF